MYTHPGVKCWKYVECVCVWGKSNMFCDSNTVFSVLLPMLLSPFLSLFAFVYTRLSRSDCNGGVSYSCFVSLIIAMLAEFTSWKGNDFSCGQYWGELQLQLDGTHNGSFVSARGGCNQWWNLIALCFFYSLTICGFSHLSPIAYSRLKQVARQVYDTICNLCLILDVVCIYTDWRHRRVAWNQEYILWRDL